MPPKKCPEAGRLKSLSALLIICLVFSSCKQKLASQNEFGKYIEAFTSGIVSKTSSIRVRLSGDLPLSHARGEALPDDVFEFEPALKGQAVWLDARTVEFRPAANLQPGTRYKASFRLQKITHVKDRFREFPFAFQVIKPAYEMEDGGLRAMGSSYEYMQLRGVLTSADQEDASRIEKILSAKYGSASLKIRWVHHPETREHAYTVDSIKRGPEAENLNLSWNGSPIDSRLTGHQDVQVPKLGDFKVLQVKAVGDPEQYVLVQFSDPLTVSQDLRGLIAISTVDDPRFTIEGSEVKVYAPARLEGSLTGAVQEGIRNGKDQKLQKAFVANLFFENTQPSVTLPGKGVILPGSGKLLMPFEAVNLNAVDVSIIKIYTSNIPQFLQTNNIDGESELRRVGKPVVHKTIRLDADKSLNLHKKNRFFLDLDKLLRTEPGAIYRVTIGFKPVYNLLKCSISSDAGEADASEGDMQGGYSEGEDRFNDGDNSSSKLDEDDQFWADYQNYYPYGYDWQKRKDPCSPSYYNKEKWATRNVLASNIGLIAKQGSEKRVVVMVNDILTAKPLAGVSVQLLDYQQQVISKGKSGSDGMIEMEATRKPWLLIAASGEQRGYLKLEEGLSLPLSRFDVGGDQVQGGVKGFIYTERDVRRPGDSIYVSFMLDDRANRLPQNFPVSFELYNPKGQLIKKLAGEHGDSKVIVFRTATSNDAITGVYNAKIKVGANTYEKQIRVETIMPNRLKINLDFGAEKEITPTSDAQASLSAKWLFGGTASHLKAKIDATLVPVATSFAGFSKFIFDDPVRNFSSEQQTVFESALSEEGTARINTRFSLSVPPPGMLRENFLVKVFEPGGSFSIDQASMPYHYYKSYVGIQAPKGEDLGGMLMTDRDHDFPIVNVGTDGKLLGGSYGSGQVEVSLYKIEWRWWWDSNAGNLANFTQDKNNQLLKSERLSLSGGKGSYRLRINTPNFGRYLVRVKDLASGHVTGKIIYVDWPGWAERVMADNPENASMLSFTSDKTSYQAGENVHISIPSSAGGRVLVSLESGSRILKTYWMETTAGQTRFDFKAEAGMAPNIFVNVTLLQPHGQKKNDLPIRMYGVIPLTIEDKSTILKPVIGMPESLRPESRTNVTVSEAGAREMTYTLAVVDEGLLDITGFKTPDPHASFYAREALGVKTWDLYDNVLGAWGGSLERILSIGGDASKLSRNSGADVSRANRFKPVVKFLGPFHLARGAKNTHVLTLQPYIGSLRVMVIASSDGSYGSVEKSVKVKKPLMLLATLPRVLGPGESLSLPVTVFGMENFVHSADVKVDAGSLLSLDGSANQTATFSKPGEQLLNFKLKVGARTGIAKVHIKARSGNESASYDVELAVRNPNPYLTAVQQTVLDPGKNWQATYTASGDPADASVKLEVSSIPSIGLSKRLGYLITYPYGCVEQITSSAFPQIYLDQLSDLSSRQKAESDHNIKAAIARLQGYQTSEGGLAYWPGSPEADEWSTSYAGHFLLEASGRGYQVPSGILGSWKRFQRNKANAWAPSTSNFYGGDLLQAYRLYTLALAQVPELGAMNRLREFKYLSLQARWRLAAAYALAGQRDIALRMTRNLETQIKPYQQSLYTYGSDLRDQAMILETLTLLKDKQRALPLLTEVASRLSQDSWYSTQTTAFSLLAIGHFCGTTSAASKLDFTWSTGGKTMIVKESKVLSQLALPVSGATLAVENRGSNVLYIKLLQESRPAPGESFPAYNVPEVLQMGVSFMTLDGKELDAAHLTQGSDFVAAVSIKNPGRQAYYANLALAQIFPSGWEILNTRMIGDNTTWKSSASDYMDVRDDRVLTYFGLGSGETHTYYVLLNASYAGRYFMAPVSCEAMYDHSIRAQTEGRWVEVVPAAGSGK